MHVQGILEISEIKQSGVKVILHSDGYTMPLFEDLVKLDIDGYQAIEGDAGMNIGLLKERYVDKLCLLGNADCGYTLSKTSVGEVILETRNVIDKAGYGGGLVMGSSNSIHDGVKLENFLASLRPQRNISSIRVGLSLRSGLHPFLTYVVAFDSISTVSVGSYPP